MTNTTDTPPAGSVGRKPRKSAAKKAGAARRTAAPRQTATATAADPAEPEATPPPARPVGRPTNVSKRADRYTQRLDEVGEAIQMIEPTDGAIIRRGSRRLGNALAELAEQNAGVAKLLDGATLGGAYTQVGLASLAIILPIVMHHVAPVPPEPAPVAGPTIPTGPQVYATDDHIGAFVAEPTVDRSDPAPPPPAGDPARVADPARPWMQPFAAVR
jgi:hypothetical protein